MKKLTGVILILLCVAWIVLGLLILKTGFEKKDNYYNPEGSSLSSENAYVGGDAYNYIINGTYFTGYVVMGSSLLIISAITGVGGLYFALDKYWWFSKNVYLAEVAV